MHGFPIFSRNHLDGVPGAAVKERAIRPFAGALLAANAEIRINLDAAEGRMIFVRHPEHAAFDRAVFDAGRRARAAGAAVRGDGQDARLLFPHGFAVAYGHGPVFFDNVVHAFLNNNTLT